MAEDRGQMTRPEGGEVERDVPPAPCPLPADPWNVAGLTLGSRVLLGTSRYPSLQVLLDCLDASGAELVTVAVRRVRLDEDGGESLLGALRARGAAGVPQAGAWAAAAFWACLNRSATLSVIWAPWPTQWSTRAMSSTMR